MTSNENYRSDDVTTDPPGFGSTGGTYSGATGTDAPYSDSLYPATQPPVPEYPPATGAMDAPSTWAGPSGTSSTTDVAKEQASSLASGAGDAAQHVTGVAKEQVGHVAAEGGRQLRQLWGQAQSELSDQASSQQQRASSGLRSLGQQLSSMANGSDTQGVATDLARQAADKSHQFAGWLENREPSDLLNEVRSFARRRPGMFLAVAAGAGLLAGRLARGLSANPDEQSGSGRSTAQSFRTDTTYRSPAYGAVGTDPLPLHTGTGVGTAGVGTYGTASTADAYPVADPSWSDLSTSAGRDQR